MKIKFLLESVQLLLITLPYVGLCSFQVLKTE